jgi:hypothetical protein
MQLSAQMVDVNLNRIALHLVPPAVQLLFKLFSRKHPARAAHQCMQQVEFPHGKHHGLTIKADLAGRRVQRYAVAG